MRPLCLRLIGLQKGEIEESGVRVMLNKQLEMHAGMQYKAISDRVSEACLDSARPARRDHLRLACL